MRGKRSLQNLSLFSGAMPMHAYPSAPPQYLHVQHVNVEGASPSVLDPSDDRKRGASIEAWIKDASSRQLTATEKSQSTTFLANFCDLVLLTTDPKHILPRKGGELDLPLISYTCTRIATKQRRYCPEEREMMHLDIAKLHDERGIVKPSQTTCAAACACIRNMGETRPLGQDDRRINTTTATDDGEGIGNMRRILDRVKGSGRCLSIEIASGYHP